MSLVDAFRRAMKTGATASTKVVARSKQVIAAESIISRLGDELKQLPENMRNQLKDLLVEALNEQTQRIVKETNENTERILRQLQTQPPSGIMTKGIMEEAKVMKIDPTKALIKAGHKTLEQMGVAGLPSLEEETSLRNQLNTELKAILYMRGKVKANT